MNCNEFTSLLDQIGKGEASKEDRARLEQHAAACEKCRIALDLRELYAQEEVPSDASARWRKALAEEEAPKRMNPTKSAAVWTRYLATAAAVVFVVVGALSVRQKNPNAALSAKSSESRTATADYETDSTEYADSGVPTMRMAAGAPNGADMVSMAEQTAEKIIKTASLTIKTDAFDDDLAQLKALALNQGGRVESERMSGDQASGTLRSASLTLRIPAASLDTYLDGTKGIAGRVTSSNQSIEDVSESYYDIQGRLDTQKAKMERLLELLKKAESVSDLIELENAVSDTQYMIDNYSGQLKGYDDKVAYSTVSLSIKEERVRDTAEDTSLTFWQRVQAGVQHSFEAVVEFLSDAGVFLVIAAPWLAIAAVLVGGIVLLRRRGKKRETRKEEKKDV